MTTFPHNIGIVGVGDGKVVLPSPPIEEDWNPLYRGIDDRTFRWKLVTGLEPLPDDLGYQFVEPSHYRLEVTPDLGWTNKEQMFEPYLDATIGNARLEIFDFLEVGTELTSLGDESVTFTLTEEQIKKILAPGFENYLWRVMAVSPAGHSGYPSTIEPFTGRVWVPELAWSIGTAPEVASQRTVQLNGTKTARIERIEINGSDRWTTYPTVESWQADVPLTPGMNSFFLRAFDTQGNGTQYELVQIELTSKTINTGEYFNRFDDFGYMLSLQRLPGEYNHAYRRRISDVMTHRGSPLYHGLMNSIGRELDLEYEDQAVLLDAAFDPETGSRYSGVVAWLGSRYLYIQRETFARKYEYQRVEGRTWQVHPDYVLNGTVEICLEPGQVIPEDCYEVISHPDGPYIQFHDEQYAGKKVYLTYFFAQKISIAGRTVQEVVDELNALTVNGSSVITATIKTGYESKSAEMLQLFPPTLLGAKGTYRDAGGVETDLFPIRWTTWRLDALMDREFKSQFVNEFGSQQGTKYAGWAYRLKNQLRTTWGYLRADHNVWSHPKIRVSGMGSIDHVYDAHRGHWETTWGSEPYALPSATAAYQLYQDPRDRSSLVFRGIPWNWFRSGYAFGFALKVLVDEEALEVETESEGVQTIRQTVGTLDGTYEDLGVGTIDTGAEVS